MCQIIEGFGLDCQLSVTKAARVDEGAFEEAAYLIIGEGFKDKDPGAGKEGGIDFKGGIFGGGADQRDLAALDIREKSILLRFVEAMDFIDKKEGFASMVAAFLPGFSDDLPHLFDTIEDGREEDKATLSGLGDNLSQGRLSGSRWSPEDCRGETVGFNQSS